MDFETLIMSAYARCLINIFYNQMNDHWSSSDYEYDKKMSEDKRNLETIIENHNFVIPWRENATIDEIMKFCQKNEN